MKRYLAPLLVFVLLAPAAGPLGMASASPVRFPPELWLMNSDGSEARPIFPSEPDGMSSVSDHSWSPDGTEIAFIGDAALHIYSLVTETYRLALELDSASYVDWSPTGEWLAIGVNWGSPQGLFLVRPDGTGWHQVGPDAQAVAPKWSPDGSRVAATYFYGPEDAVHLTLVTPEGDSQVVATDINFTRSSWSPDGSRLAFGDKSHRLSIVDADGTVSKITAANTAYGDVAWSPDGSKIAYAGPDGIFAIDPDGGAPLKLLDYGRDVGWDPTGTWVVASVAEDIVRVAVDGSGKTVLSDLPDRSDNMPRWSPEGSHISYLSAQWSSPPPNATVHREVRLRQRGHLVLKGRVLDVGDTPASCTWTQTRVLLQRRKTGRWVRIARPMTDEDGRFRARVADRTGRYRAIVRKKTFYQPGPGNEVTCTWARSRRIVHRH